MLKFSVNLDGNNFPYESIVRKLYIYIYITGTIYYIIYNNT